MSNNLGNVVGLLPSDTPPIKKYILWAKLITGGPSDNYEINYWNAVAGAWQPFGESRFISDPILSLAGGDSLGKYHNGDSPAWTGLTAIEALQDAGVAQIYPTYVIATLGLTQSQPVLGEVGESLSNSLIATFTQHDAGVLSSISIFKNGSNISPSGSTSPFSKTDAATRILGNITYQAFATYAAGALKNIFPSGNPDDRTPQIRNVNAPQAAESNFPSVLLNFTGVYKIFYGHFSIVPSNSAGVRASPQNRFTSDSHNFILDTQSTDRNFCIWLPTGLNLISVFDIQTSNLDVTSSFHSASLTIKDAGGTNNATGNLWTMTNAVPYTENHQFNVTIG